MLFDAPIPTGTPERRAVQAAYLADEATALERALAQAELAPEVTERIRRRARDLVLRVRERSRDFGGIDELMHEYDLSSQEGIILLCLAEALLRIPDSTTADRLIQDKLGRGDWTRHLGHSDSFLVNAATWGLMLTGRLIELDSADTDAGVVIKRLVSRAGEPVVRAALKEAMRILGHQFVTGRTIEEAIERGEDDRRRGYRFSFDMLGEAAVTAFDAERCLHRYEEAIRVIAARCRIEGDVFAAPGISVKLSALHPRFEFAQRARLMEELVPRVLSLAGRTKEIGIGLTLDAEEADRLEVTLDVFEAVFRDPLLSGWEGLGLAVQAYQKRGLPVVDWLIELARKQGRRIPVRLTKGAYWDAEIKHAQERGLSDYPVFTRKAASDVSYLACARRLLQANDSIYPQFATHNAYTLASIVELIEPEQAFEMQRLHGMGEALYDVVREELGDRIPCRIYAPVGSHADLLPYLVRRLLENGSNTSFVNRLEDAGAPVETLIADPVSQMRSVEPKRHPRIPRPPEIFGAERQNARGRALDDPEEVGPLAEAMAAAARESWRATPLIGGETIEGEPQPVASPADRHVIVGQVVETQPEQVDMALSIAADAAGEWARQPVQARAALLMLAADLIEGHQPELMTLCVREGGRCVPDALAEVREAIDFCRYYAKLADDTFPDRLLQGPTGERNSLHLHGRGVFVCISPWNFPIAIFTGQIVAALVAGNAVVAKPARQTPLAALRIVTLLHEAGIPPEVLQLLPGSSGLIGQPLVTDPRTAGIAFTGSTDTARTINRRLATRDGPIVPLIAETGGQNAMIVDSSALPEQVVTDVLRSAFNSAGQRCSSLRVLFLQEDIAPRVIDLLRGAMAELQVGDPALLSTDVGPVIDDAAKRDLERHIARMKHEASMIHEVDLPADTRHGSYVAPTAVEIEQLSLLESEVFGPILHVIRYSGDRLNQVIDAVNSTGYGLTLGIHSRIDSFAEHVRQRVRVGNVYVNRNMIGAVVGVQPFGGEGLSGTGPKAGGPHYLHRFATERSVSINTAAMGGNASLLSLGEDSKIVR